MYLEGVKGKGNVPIVTLPGWPLLLIRQFDWHFPSLNVENKYS